MGARIAPRMPYEAGSVTLPTPDLDMAEAQIKSEVATPQSDLVDALLQGIRRLQITASQPAHVRPTVWSNPIDLSAEVTLAAAVSPYQSVVSFTVPRGYGARIEQYGMTVTDPAYPYDGTLLWGFKKNGQALDMGMSDFAQQRGSMVFPRKTVITLMPDDLIEFQVQRALAAGPAYTVQMGIRGWLFRLRNTNLGTQAVATAY